LKINSLIVIGLCIFFCSCSETDNVEEPNEIESPILQSFSFSDGFEGVGENFNALFVPDSSRWSRLQMVNPANQENKIGLTNTIASEGNYSLSLLSVGSDETLSKVDIEKGGLVVSEGQTVDISAKFFIESDANLENLLLIDLECCDCWDPNVPENKCPGVRLMLSGGNDYLSIERGKIGLETLKQDLVRFPRNEWVKVRWVMNLSSSKEGMNQLYLNDRLVIDETESNFPNEEIFKATFAAEGINFNLQKPVSYERVQIGATANPTTEEIQIYVDDFSLQVTND